MTTLPFDDKRFISLLDKIRKLGSASKAYFGADYDFEGGYFLQQNADELAALCLFLIDNGPYANYLEIGTASGGTCLALYQLVGFSNVFTIDIGTHIHFIHQQKHLSQIPNVQQFIGDSHSPEAEEWLQKNAKDPFDVIFIDGDHREESVSKDVQLSIKFSHPGTIFIFHDIHVVPGVLHTWRRIIEEKIIISLAGYIGRKHPMGIGIGKVI